MSGRDDEVREARIRADVLRRERYHNETTQRIFEAIAHGQPSTEQQPARDHALTQDEARALVERYGSLRKAAANSTWSASHIARVKNGERGKPSI